MHVNKSNEDKLMRFYTEWRLEGDEYCGGFINGTSLSGSESTKGMTEIESDKNITVFKGKNGHIIQSLNIFIIKRYRNFQGLFSHR